MHPSAISTTTWSRAPTSTATGPIPIYLNSSGFDPSLFHDDDGKKYLLNMLWDHRPGQNRFAGIVMQEFSTAEQRLVGERRVIFSGTPLGLTEGPHLYKRGGYYHLITAEGGTSWGHAVTMARAREIEGPYELHPDVHVLSARHRPDVALQRAGHADLVDTPDGSTYMVYLCGRPLPNRGRCTLGRETAIQKMVWGEDGWLRTVAGDGLPAVETEAPRVAAPSIAPQPPAREHFDGAQLPIDFQWLRSPWPDELFSLTERPGFLRLYGRETVRQPVQPGARRAPAAVALLQRVDDRRVRAAALPADGRADLLLQQLQVPLPVHLDGRRAPASTFGSCRRCPTSRRRTRSLPRSRFRRMSPWNCASRSITSVCISGIASAVPTWTWIPQQFDASILSDEATAPGLPNFTGAFVGMACQDMSGARCPADFDWFEYVERPYRVDPFGPDHI